LKNNTEVTNSKCYVFTSSAICAYFSLQTLKKDDKYLALSAVLGWLRPCMEWPTKSQSE